MILLGGPSGSGYYEETKRRRGPISVSIQPSWEWADSGHSGSGWYTDSGATYGAGSYDSDGQVGIQVWVESVQLARYTTIITEMRGVMGIIFGPISDVSIWLG